jgi:hypothetical protein
MKGKMKMKKFLNEKLMTKKDGGKEVLVELGLAIIGIVLLAVFSTSAQGIISSITSQISTAIADLF